MNMFWLMLYIFFAAYDYYDPLGIASYCTTSKLLAAFYIISSVLKKFSIRKILYINLGVVSMFVFCGYFLLITCIKAAEYGWDVSSESLSSIVSILLCMVMASCLVREMQVQKVRDKAGMVFLMSIISVAVLLLLGIGVSYKGDRIRFFGCNSNTLGFYGVMALVLPFVMSKTVFSGWSHLCKAVFYASSVLAGLYLIYESGSLGALVIVGVTVPIILIRFVMAKNKLLHWPLLIVFLLFGVRVIIQDFATEDSVAYQRLVTMSERTDVYDENRILSGRLHIWENSWRIFRSSPLTGVGDTMYRWEMLRLTGVEYSTHSLYLELLAKTGLIGFALFMVPIETTAAGESLAGK